MCLPCLAWCIKFDIHVAVRLIGYNHCEHCAIENNAIENNAMQNRLVFGICER